MQFTLIYVIVTPPTTGTALTKYSSFSGYAHLSAGLCCGLSGLAAGMAIGIVGDAGVRAVGQQERLFVGMILILIFAEALGTKLFSNNILSSLYCIRSLWSHRCFDSLPTELLLLNTPHHPSLGNAPSIVQ